MTTPKLTPRLRKNQNTEAKFWSMTRPTPAGCWEFTGCLIRGYGTVRYEGRNYRAHRLAFFFTHGRDPIGLVLHSCDNPRCVNPAHLREGSAKDNSRDAVTRGRTLRGSKNPASKLDEEKVRNIHHLHKQGLGLGRLAKMFGVSHMAIKYALSGETWGHVK